MMNTGCVIKESAYHGLKSIIMENSAVKVVVLPELGGRVIEYVLKSSGNNQLYHDLTTAFGRSASGIMMLVGIGNENLNADIARYKHTFCNFNSGDNDGCRVVLTRFWRFLKIDISYSIFDNSTELGIDVKVTNTGGTKVNAHVNFHPLWSVGGRIDNSTLLTVPSASGLVRYHFNHKPCYEFFVPSARWSAVANYSKSESVLIRTFDDPGRYYIYSDQRIYTLETYSAVKSIGRGEALNFRLKCLILSGIGAIDHFDGRTGMVKGVALNKSVYEQPELVELHAGVGSVSGSIAGTMKIEAVMSRKGKKLAGRQISLKLNSRGDQSGRTVKIFFPTKGLPDGQYRISVKGNIGTTTAKTTLTLNLCSAKMKKLRTDYKQMKNRFNILRKKLAASFYSGSVACRESSATPGYGMFALLGLWTRLKLTGDLLAGCKNAVPSVASHLDERDIKNIQLQLQEAKIRADAIAGEKYLPVRVKSALGKPDDKTSAETIWETWYTDDKFFERRGVYHNGVPLPLDVTKGVRRQLGRLTKGAVTVRKIKDILEFDFCSCVVGCHERCVMPVARKLAKSVNGNQPVLIRNAAPDNEFLVRLSLHRYPVIDFIQKRGSKVVEVKGRNTAEIMKLSRILLSLVKLLKDREILMGDLHTHTNISPCGKGEPVYTVISAVRNHFDFIAITDHDTPAGALEARRQIGRLGIKYPLIIGQEMSLPDQTTTHILLLGYKKIIPCGTGLDHAIDLVRRAGGIAILSHPGRNPKGCLADVEKAALADNKPDLDGFEVSMNKEFLGCCEAWLKGSGMPKAVVVNSDAHMPIFPKFHRTIVFASANTTGGILKAIKEKNCIGYANGQFYGSPVLVDLFKIILKEEEYLRYIYYQRQCQSVRMMVKRIINEEL